MNPAQVIGNKIVEGAGKALDWIVGMPERILDRAMDPSQRVTPPSVGEVAELALAMRGGSALSPCKCFIAGTLVHTSTDLVKIEDVKVGDLVAARDENTGEVAWKPALGLIHDGEKEVLHVRYTDDASNEEFLGVTSEHPFMLEASRWVKAGELRPNDKVMRLNGSSLTITGVDNYSGKHRTYNFEVADFHTYFVGVMGAWVHNAPCGLRNGHLAGDTHPKTDVPFDKNGYPDFSALSKAEVKIVQTGSRAGDFRAANEAAGSQKTPEGFTWHHHQDGTPMQLVPRDIHAKTGHTGALHRIHENMIRIDEQGRKITEGDIVSLEGEVGMKLPKSYRQFLLSSNGGIPSPDVVDVAGHPEALPTFRFFLMLKEILNQVIFFGISV